MKKLLLPLLLLAALVLPLTGCTGTEQTRESEPQVTVMTYDYDLNINFLYHIDNDTYITISTTEKDGTEYIDARLVNMGESRIAPGWSIPNPQPGRGAFTDTYCMPTDTGVLLLDEQSGIMLQVNAAAGTITEYAVHDEVATTEHSTGYCMGDRWLLCDLYAQPGEWQRTSTTLSLWDATYRNTGHLVSLPDGIADAKWSTDDERLYVLTYEGTVIAVDPVLQGGTAWQYNFAAAAPQSDDIGVLCYVDMLPIYGNDMLALHISCEAGDQLQIVDTKEYAATGCTFFDREIILLGAYQSDVYMLNYYLDLNGNKCCSVLRYNCLTNEYEIIFNCADWQMAEPGCLLLDGGSVSPDGSHLLLEGLYYTFSTLSHVDPAEQILLRLDLE